MGDASLIDLGPNMMNLLRGNWQPADPNAPSEGRPLVGSTQQTGLSAGRAGYAPTLGRSIGNSINVVNGSLAKRKWTEQRWRSMESLREDSPSLFNSPPSAYATANAGQVGAPRNRNTFPRPAVFQLPSALELEEVRVWRLTTDCQQRDPFLSSAQKIAANWLGGNLHSLFFSDSAPGDPYFGISRSALNTGRLPQLWSTIPHCAFSV